MSAAAGVLVSAEPRAFSIGPWKIQIFNVAIVSGDTTAVCTANRMNSVIFGMLSGSVTQTAAATFSGNAATFTFTDPAASVYCQAILIGR